LKGTLGILRFVFRGLDKRCWLALPTGEREKLFFTSSPNACRGALNLKRFLEGLADPGPLSSPRSAGLGDAVASTPRSSLLSSIDSVERPSFVCSLLDDEPLQTEIILNLKAPY
jgi:hypothetical protein